MDDTNPTTGLPEQDLPETPITEPEEGTPGEIPADGQ